MKIELLQDDFSGALSDNWQNSGGGAFDPWEYIDSGQLVLECRSDYQGQIESKDVFDLTQSSIEVEIIQRPTQGGDNTTEMYFGVRNSVDPTDQIRFVLTGAGNMVVQQMVNNAQQGGTSVAYNTTAHRWLRIRVADNNVIFEGSPDGLSYRRISLYALHAGMDATSVRAYMMTGFWGTQATPGVGRYDNLNVVPHGPRFLWQNSSATSSVKTSASVNVELTKGFPAGSTVLVAVVVRNASATLSNYSVVDDVGNTYVLDFSSFDTSGFGLLLFRADNITALVPFHQVYFQSAATAHKASVGVSNWAHIAGPVDVSSLNPADGAASVSTNAGSGATPTSSHARFLAFGLVGRQRTFNGTGGLQGDTSQAGWGRINTQDTGTISPEVANDQAYLFSSASSFSTAQAVTFTYSSGVGSQLRRFGVVTYEGIDPPLPVLDAAADTGLVLGADATASEISVEDASSSLALGVDATPIQIVFATADTSLVLGSDAAPQATTDASANTWLQLNADALVTQAVVASSATQVVLGADAAPVVVADIAGGSELVLSAGAVAFTAGDSVADSGLLMTAQGDYVEIQTAQATTAIVLHAPATLSAPLVDVSADAALQVTATAVPLSQSSEFAIATLAVAVTAAYTQISQGRALRSTITVRELLDVNFTIN